MKLAQWSGSGLVYDNVTYIIVQSMGLINIQVYCVTNQSDVGSRLVFTLNNVAVVYKGAYKGSLPLRKFSYDFVQVMAYL